MKLRKAITWSMSQYPEFYLVHPEALFVEATNAAAEIFTMAEMLAELNGMETDKLAVSQRVQGIVKWKLTGAGRAWLKES